MISNNWSNGANSGAGAVTWGNGATGAVGSVSTTNSLVGTKTGDHVGCSGVIALTNGNYVVASPNWWYAGTEHDAGAATWGNGGGGTVGPGWGLAKSASNVGGQQASAGA